MAGNHVGDGAKRVRDGDDSSWHCSHIPPSPPATASHGACPPDPANQQCNNKTYPSLTRSTLSSRHRVLQRHSSAVPQEISLGQANVALSAVPPDLSLNQASGAFRLVNRRVEIPKITLHCAPLGALLDRSSPRSSCSDTLSSHSAVPPEISFRGSQRSTHSVW